MTYECQWCGGDRGGFIGVDLHYCSNDCWNAAIEHAAERHEALINGEEPPSKDEFMDRRQRARKWSPDAMRERVAELRNVARGGSA
jgi:hypothetical protein